MLSGIGPADHLKEHEIDCIADLPGVGQNLIDHPEVPMSAYANGRYGYYRQGVGWRMLKNGLHFKLFGSGPITSAGVEAGAYINPLEPDAPPSIQAFFVPIVYLDRDAIGVIDDGYGMTITTVVVKPKSRGEVRLASNDPSDMPLVSPNLLKDEDDMKTMIAGQRSSCVPSNKNRSRAGSAVSSFRNLITSATRPWPVIATHGQDQLPPRRHRPDGSRR